MAIVDEIIPEPEGGAHHTPEATVRLAGERLMHHIEHLSALPMQVLLDQRYQKYRVIGAFTQAATPQHGHGDIMSFL
jgi:acetyl-CoA carboxylase carboxyl transferase subunit alpha